MPLTLGRGRQISVEFEAILVYIASSRPVRIATRRKRRRRKRRRGRRKLLAKDSILSSSGEKTVYIF